jgi:hypothetical protein
MPLGAFVFKESNCFKFRQPVIKPQWEEGPTIDILFGPSKRLKGGTEKSFVPIGDDSEGFVKFRTLTLALLKELLIKTRNL